MNLVLERFSYSSTETEGSFALPGVLLATIELPWIPFSSPGGKPFESCVPDGEYMLEPWVRAKGELCYLLYNPELGVYRTESSRPENSGRYLCLIHTANWVSDVVGCIGVGMQRDYIGNPKTRRLERAVSGSGAAMATLIKTLGREATHSLRITPRLGAGGTS